MVLFTKIDRENFTTFIFRPTFIGQSSQSDPNLAPCLCTRVFLKFNNVSYLHVHFQLCFMSTYYSDQQRMIFFWKYFKEFLGDFGSQILENNFRFSVSGWVFWLFLSSFWLYYRLRTGKIVISTVNLSRL